MTAETERIAQGTPHFALLRLVQREVQVRVDLRVEVLAVDGRGNHAVRDGEDDYQLYLIRPAKMQARASAAPAAPSR